MLIRLQKMTPDGREDYAIMVNTDDISLIMKDSHDCGSYYPCDHSVMTIVVMKNGEKFFVDESINTIEARIERATE